MTGPAPLCTMCLRFHRRQHGFTCDAFPSGIPDELIWGECDHRAPYPGDRGMGFLLKPGVTLPWYLLEHAGAYGMRLEVLEHAVAFAALIQTGQRDKADAVYILHPLRVMMRVTTEPERMAAILHDVLEDTSTTAEDLRLMGCPGDVVDAVECLTHRADELYLDFIARVGTNPIARNVKIADLQDNLDLSRLPEVTVQDRQRQLKYQQALAVLQPTSATDPAPEG